MPSSLISAIFTKVPWARKGLTMRADGSLHLHRGGRRGKDQEEKYSAKQEPAAGGLRPTPGWAVYISHCLGQPEDQVQSR